MNVISNKVGKAGVYLSKCLGSQCTLNIGSYPLSCSSENVKLSEIKVVDDS